MRIHRVTIYAARAIILASLALIACRGDSPVAPTERPHGLNHEPDLRNACASECVLATGAMFLRAVAPRADSTAPLTVGDFRIRGNPGATVVVRLEADGQLARALGQSGLLLVAVNGERSRRVAFDSLLPPGGATVYRFGASSEIRLHYAVERNLAVSQAGTFRLVQYVSGATIAQSTTPWGEAAATLAVASGTSSCSATGPSGTSCGVDYTISPYVSYGGGRFSDAVCCGPSGPITVTFAAPVDTITVTIHDPTYAGNHMVAHGALGDLTAQFAYTNQPGNDVPDTQTLVGPGIYQVDLIPSSGIANGDWVTWQLWFATGPFLVVSCSPNPVLRGEQVVCMAQSSDSAAAPLVMSDWKFTGPALSQPISENSSSTTWSGVIATDGTVEAHGTLAGADATGQTQLAVTPRTWNQPFDTVRFSINPAGSAGLPAQPKNAGGLGATGLEAQAQVRAGSGFTQIQNGPNRNVLYLTEVPIIGVATVHINYVAMSVGSDFYNKQAKKRTGGGNLVPYCSQDDVVPYLPRVEEHEGLNFQAGSHSWVYRSALNQQVPQLTEPVVALDAVDELDSLAQAAAQPGIDYAYLTAKDDTAPGGTVKPVLYPCKFRFF